VICFSRRIFKVLFYRKKKDSRPAWICCLFCEERGKKGAKAQNPRTILDVSGPEPYNKCWIKCVNFSMKN